MARLSQKMVQDRFYEMCKNMGVPTVKTRDPRKKYKRGHFKVGYAYGRMQIQYIHPLSGSSDVTGYLTASELWDTLSFFDPKSQYNRFKEADKNELESVKRRESYKTIHDVKTQSGASRTVYPISQEQVMRGNFGKSYHIEGAIRQAGSKKIYQTPNGMYVWRK